jgi:hypothetical protein
MPAKHDLTPLWPWLAGADARLSRAVRSGALSQTEVDRIVHLTEKGFVIFPQAIEADRIDALLGDVRRIGRHPGCFVTTDHRHGRRQRYSDGGFDTYESIFDTYVPFESARQVCFHPMLTRFLRSIFDTAAVAHQQLLFQRSNQHPLHQDTSVVCLEKPLWMVASWIALEDVVPGRGELTYYEGSHAIPHIFFSDGTKRLNAKTDDEKAVQRALLEHCQRLKLPKRNFIAKKGDVFVWAADLVHGSNPRTRPEEETRMSLVTHYHPENTDPFWFRFYPDNRGTVRYDDDALYQSMYYALPAQKGMPRPNYRIED